MNQFNAPMTPLTKADIPHGTRAIYRRGCRCDLCVEAHKAYMREFRRKHAERRQRESVVEWNG
jgi:queuine/archaeosine tRNA-ribosyltransferase